MRSDVFCPCTDYQDFWIAPGTGFSFGTVIDCGLLSVIPVDPGSEDFLALNAGESRDDYVYTRVARVGNAYDNYEVSGVSFLGPAVVRFEYLYSENNYDGVRIVGGDQAAVSGDLAQAGEAYEGPEHCPWGRTFFSESAPPGEMVFSDTSRRFVQWWTDSSITRGPNPRGGFTIIIRQDSPALTQPATPVAASKPVDFTDVWYEWELRWKLGPFSSESKARKFERELVRAMPDFAVKGIELPEKSWHGGTKFHVNQDTYRMKNNSFAVTDNATFTEFQAFVAWPGPFSCGMQTCFALQKFDNYPGQGYSYQGETLPGIALEANINTLEEYRDCFPGPGEFRDTCCYFLPLLHISNCVQRRCGDPNAFPAGISEAYPDANFLGSCSQFASGSSGFDQDLSSNASLVSNFRLEIFPDESFDPDFWRQQLWIDRIGRFENDTTSPAPASDPPALPGALYHTVFSILGTIFEDRIPNLASYSQDKHSFEASNGIYLRIFARKDCAITETGPRQVLCAVDVRFSATEIPEAFFYDLDPNVVAQKLGGRLNRTESFRNRIASARNEKWEVSATSPKHVTNPKTDVDICWSRHANALGANSHTHYGGLGAELELSGGTGRCMDPEWMNSTHSHTHQCCVFLREVLPILDSAGCNYTAVQRAKKVASPNTTGCTFLNLLNPERTYALATRMELAWRKWEDFQITSGSPHTDSGLPDEQEHFYVDGQNFQTASSDVQMQLITVYMQQVLRLAFHKVEEWRNNTGTSARTLFVKSAYFEYQPEAMVHNSYLSGQPTNREEWDNAVKGRNLRLFVDYEFGEFATRENATEFLENELKTRFGSTWQFGFLALTPDWNLEFDATNYYLANYDQADEAARVLMSSRGIAGPDTSGGADENFEGPARNLEAVAIAIPPSFLPVRLDALFG